MNWPLYDAWLAPPLISANWLHCSHVPVPDGTSLKKFEVNSRGHLVNIDVTSSVRSNLHPGVSSALTVKLLKLNLLSALESLKPVDRVWKWRSHFFFYDDIPALELRNHLPLQSQEDCFSPAPNFSKGQPFRSFQKLRAHFLHRTGGVHLPISKVAFSRGVLTTILCFGLGIAPL